MGNKQATQKRYSCVYRVTFELLTESQKKRKEQTLLALQAKYQNELDSIKVDNRYFKTYSEEFQLQIRVLDWDDIKAYLQGKSPGSQSLHNAYNNYVRELICVLFNNKNIINSKQVINLKYEDSNVIEVVFHENTVLKKILNTSTKIFVGVPSLIYWLSTKLVRFLLFVNSIRLLFQNLSSLRVLLKSILPIIMLISPALGQVLMMI